MKHDKKIYSRRLMNEAMRQIKLPGIIGTLLLVGGGLLLCHCTAV